MNKILTTLLCLVLLPLLANDTQIPVNEKTGLAEYVNVVKVGGTTAAQMHDRAKKWIHGYFANPHKVITSEDTIGYEIEGKARFRMSVTDKKGNVSPAGFVAFKFTLMFKEGRYRYHFHRIRWEQPSYFDVSRWEKTDDPQYQAEMYPKYVEQTVNYFNTMLDGLEEAVATPEEVESSDW